MKKSDVYKLIGYNGEYNANVKKAIRKLLKENHPDNKGSRETFELINEIKKELESGKIPTIKKEVSKNNDLDYDYYYKLMSNLKIKKNDWLDQIDNKKSILNDYENEYKVLYQKSLNLENSLVNTPVNKTSEIKVLSCVLIIMMIMILLIAVLTNNNVLFAIFVILAIIGILVIQKKVLLVHKNAEKNKKSIASYVKINNEIKENIKKQGVIKKEIRDLKVKITNIENDLRFYKNLLK